ncbi:hypothetical protein PGB90_008519 [Kerria lacca]
MENGIPRNILELPFLMNFQNSLTVGTAVLIEGIVPENASMFLVNFGAPIECCFCSSSEKEIAFNLSLHFDKRCVSRNSTKKTKWRTEQVTGNMLFPLTRGCRFLIEIFVAGKELLIAINGIHYCSFVLQTALRLINSLEINGDCQLNSVSIKIDENKYPYPWIIENENLAECININCDSTPTESNLRVPLMCILSRTLQPADVIKVEGKIKLLPYSFTIDLQNNELCWPHPDILLHVNARYNYSQKNKKNAFVLNNWSNSKWGSEKTVYNRSLPMPGTIFQILIVCGLSLDHDFITLRMYIVTQLRPYFTAEKHVIKEFNAVSTPQDKLL